MGRSFEEELKVIASEKAAVKKVSGVLMLEAGWQPIAMEWFEKWKLYVDYTDSADVSERSAEFIQSLYPGPIDNSSLASDFGDELKRGIVENQDYVLYPTDVVNKLFIHYGGGPKFPRTVKNIGNDTHPLLQVVLYPVRFEIYHCNELHPQPKAKPDSVRYYSTNPTFKTAVESFKSLFFLTGATIRVWVKDKQFSPSCVAVSDVNADCQSMNIAEVDDNTMDNDPNKRARTTEGSRRSRHIISEEVERDGPWKLMRNFSTSTATIRDILGEDESIEIIIESVRKYQAQEHEWERSKFIQQWKTTLRQGDLIDACDKQRKWYVSRVKGQDSDGNLSVHFLGWDESSDEVIPMSDFAQRIQCLHVRTLDRLSFWKEGSDVDVRVSEMHQKGVWIPGKVMEIDSLHERVKVSYSKKLRDTNLKLLLPVSATTTAASSTVDEASSTTVAPVVAMDIDVDTNDGSDDAIKKRNTNSQSLALIPINNDLRSVSERDVTVTMTGSEVENETGAVTNGNNETEESDVVEVWMDVYGDSVCPVYTHTIKPKTVSTTSTSLSSYNKTSYGTSSYSYSSYYDHVKGTPIAKGMVGLQNLGNTCFMNSILQCLSCTYPLTQVFLTDGHLKQINYDNPLGHNGKVALAYAKLMKEIWSNEYVKIAPRDFKFTIGEFQPQFAGYHQQDSQEFMNFLFDGLHEDMNRILKKPFVQKIESKGRPDDLIATESWRRFLLRNDSELVDRCFGQLKSHVTCANCRNESVTFEAYSSISLPIPIKNTKPVEILVQLLPLGSTPLKVTLDVEVSEPMSNLHKLLIDHLIATKHISIASKKEIEKAVSVTDDDFEVIEMKTAGEDDFQVISKTDRSEAHGEEESTKVENESEVSIYDRLHFQFAIAFRSRPFNVHKNYNSKSSKKTAISSFLGHSDVLLAFQLETSTPELKPSPHAVSDEKSPESENALYYAMDIGIAMKDVGTYMTTSDRISFKSLPMRVALRKGMTNREVYKKAFEVVKRFLKADSPYLQDREQSFPFELRVTNSFGTINRSVVEDDESMVFTAAVDGSDTLAVVLPSDERALSLHWDQLRFKDVVDVEATSPIEQQGGSLTLFDCFDKFVEKEQLGENDTLYCSNCKQHSAPTKKMDIWSAPDILIVHLKRFQIVAGDAGFHRREKINDFIDFPVNGLDLSKYIKGAVDTDTAPPVYDLYAVSHHMGGLGGGHYVASCKHPMNGKWYNCNDSSISETDAKSAVCDTAYVLFYQRRNGSLKWGGVVPHPHGLPDEDN